MQKFVDFPVHIWIQITVFCIRIWLLFFLEEPSPRLFFFNFYRFRVSFWVTPRSDPSALDDSEIFFGEVKVDTVCRVRQEIFLLDLPSNLAFRASVIRYLSRCRSLEIRFPVAASLVLFIYEPTDLITSVEKYFVTSLPSQSLARIFSLINPPADSILGTFKKVRNISWKICDRLVYRVLKSEKWTCLLTVLERIKSGIKIVCNRCRIRILTPPENNIFVIIF